jgi:cell division control protein 6
MLARIINITYAVIYSVETMESAIFLDQTKLSARYIPNELPHREKQIEEICHVFIGPSSPDDCPLTVLQILGSAGIGKTSTVLKCSKVLEQHFDRNRLPLVTVYVNLKLQGGNKFAIYRYLLEKLGPDIPSQGVSAEEMLRYLLRYLRESKKYALIILDEIDYLIKNTKDTGVIYDLTRLNEFEPGSPCNIKMVIFIARSKEFYGKLDHAELSSLGRIPMEFPQYTLKQVSDILDRRCSEAFKPKAIGSDIIDEVAKITTSSMIHGDIRFALDLLAYSGKLAETQGTGRITIDQVRQVYSQIHPAAATVNLDALPPSQVYTLMAVIRTIRAKRKPYVELKEIRLSALDVAEEFKLKKLEIEDHLDNLCSKKVIDIRSLKEIGIVGASFRDLEPMLLHKIKHYAENKL